MCIFVGYFENTKGGNLTDPEHPTTLEIARDVTFLEDNFYREYLTDDELDHVPLTDILKKSRICSREGNQKSYRYH